MKYFIGLIIIFFCFFALIGCQGETMDLLDEPIREVGISTSKGVGELNEDFEMSFTDPDSAEIFREGIVTARLQNKNMTQPPDYDIFVQYEGDLPTHAIYLWLGEQNKESILMYYVGDGETYVTTPDTTNQLRKLLVDE